MFPSLWVWWMFPTASQILQYAPVKAVRDFLRAGDDFNQVSTAKRCRCVQRI